MVKRKNRGGESRSRRLVLEEIRHGQGKVSCRDYQKFRSRGRIYWVMSWDNEYQMGQSDVQFNSLPGTKCLDRTC